MFQGTGNRTGLFLLLAVAAMSAASSLTAQQSKPSPAHLALPADPNQYVREVIQHELEASDKDHTLWRYHFHREDLKNNYDRDVIETKEGQLARTLLIHGQPLTAEQRADDQARLRKLVSDPEERARRSKREKEDAEKARKMLKAIPDAFLFKYDGMEDNLVQLAFKPNPRYQAPNRELQVFQSLTGRMWIDPVARRLARIDGALFEDVTFGWGLLGRLHKGGTFRIIQKNVGGDHWEIVSLDVKMNGHALIFKTVNVSQHQVQSDFRRMPDGLSIAQAFDLLENGGPASANVQPATVHSPGKQ